MELTRMPLETAEFLFALANIAAIIGGILAVLGTAGIFFLGSIREHYAGEKQAELAARTAEARRDAEAANARAAELNKESDELRLELERERTERLKLEQRMAPRRVSVQMRDNIKKLVPPDADTQLYLKVAMNNAEGDRFINEVGGACLDAGWPRDRIGGSTVAGASFPEGITVGVNPTEAIGDAIRKPAIGLLAVFKEAGVASATPFVQDTETPVGTVTIAVGLKPDAA